MITFKELRRSLDQAVCEQKIFKDIPELLDLIEGNQSRFLHIDEVKAQWHLIDPIIEKWKDESIPVHQYTAGSKDPEASKIIFENEDQFWRSSINIVE